MTVPGSKIKPVTIAILLIGVGGVYAGMQIGKKQVTPSEIISESKTPTQAVATVQPEPTMNWKTYTAPITPRNIFYQIKYPADRFDIEFRKSKGEGEDDTTFLYKGSKFDEYNGISEGLEAIFWLIFDGPLEEPVENTIINGIEARRYFHQEKGFTFLKYELKIPNTKDYFKAAASIKGAKTEELISLFDKVISTFKFLE